VAAVVILSLFAIALFSALAIAERLALPWAYRGGEERA
jgi:ABC-type nitrate/sulfonate/bicarbonate transport system permease component